MIIYKLFTLPFKNSSFAFCIWYTIAIYAGSIEYASSFTSWISENTRILLNADTRMKTYLTNLLWV